MTFPDLPPLHRSLSGAFLRARISSPAALALVLVLGLSATGCRRGADATAAGPGAGPGPPGAPATVEEAVPVQTAPVVRGPIAARLSFNSTLETESTVDLFPQIGGQVETLFVEEGDHVKAGDALLKIEDRELRVDADEARVLLARDRANFERNEELFKRGLVNQQEFENSRHTFEQRRLGAERAQIRLDHATVRAPFDGVVSARTAQVGARVGTGTKLFSLVSLQDMVARVFVPGRYLPDVHAEQPATITSEFLPGRTFEGWVKRISPVVDPQSGTFKVTVGVRNPDLDVLPGLFVRANIITEERPSALLVPKRAIVYEGGEQFIFTVREDKAVRLKLDAGFDTSDVVEVRSGLNEGDPVIVLGQSGLKDAASVKIVPVAEPTPSVTPAPAPAVVAGS